MAAEKVSEIPKLLKDARERQYFPGEKLGAGGFATCWRAQMVDRREAPETPECALKAVRAVLPKNIAWRFKLELAIQSKLHHPNIVELYRAFTCQDVTYVALELCPNGSLTDMIRKRKFLTMGEIRRILIQLCGAVKYLHERDVVHRDIKAGNIFLDEEMNVKLGDFGLAAIMEPGDVAEYARRTTFCGTPNYLAPEILCKANGHGISVDIWAVGVLAYFLAVGKAPFHAKSKEEIYEKLRKGDYSWPELAPEQNEIPEDLRNLVASLLVEESKRPTPDQIVRHPFFTCGFIPSKLDPLCKTRRPRYARVGTMQENARTYEALCRSSRVGLANSAGTAKVDRRRSKSVVIALAEEYAQGVKLTIPLKEGVVYLGRKSPTIPAVFEDDSGKGRDAVLESKFSPPLPGVLTERMVNRVTKMPTTQDQRKVQGTVVEILSDHDGKIPVPPTSEDEKRALICEKKRNEDNRPRKVEKSIVAMSNRPSSVQLRAPEHTSASAATSQNVDALQRPVDATSSKSRIERQASYRLKIARQEPVIVQEAPLAPTALKDKTGVDLEHAQRIPRIPSNSVQDIRPPPTKRIRDLLERPRSQIFTSMRVESPPRDRGPSNYISPVEAPKSSGLGKPEQRRRANIPSEDGPVTKISTSRTYHALTNPDLPSTSVPVPSNTHSNLQRTESISTSHTLHTLPQSPNQTPKPAIRTYRRKPVPDISPQPAPNSKVASPIHSRNPSASAAAAAAAAAMHAPTTSSSSPQQPPLRRTVSISDRPMMRARTLRERPLTIAAPSSEFLLESENPPETKTTPRKSSVSAAIIPTRARTLRVPGERLRRTLVSRRGVEADEEVAKEVEREIVERLKRMEDITAEKNIVVPGDIAAVGSTRARGSTMRGAAGLRRAFGLGGPVEKGDGEGEGVGKRSEGVRRAATLRAMPTRPRRAGVDYGGGF